MTSPVDQQTLVTFMTPADSDGPFARVLEFDPLLLPTIPLLPADSSQSRDSGADVPDEASPGASEPVFDGTQSPIAPGRPLEVPLD